MTKKSFDNSPLKLAFFLLFSAALALPTTAVYASDPAVVEQAKTLCLNKAKAEGYELKDVLYSGASEIPGKDAKVVLQLNQGRSSCQTDL